MVTKSCGSKRQNWSCLSSGKFVDFRRHRDTGTPPEVHGCDEVKLGDHLGHFPALICRSGDLATLWITLKTLSSYSSAFVALGTLRFGLRYALACINNRSSRFVRVSSLQAREDDFHFEPVFWRPEPC